MEDLIEFLLELILEGAIEGSKSIRIPKAVRLILLALPFLVLIGLFALLAYPSFTDGMTWLGVLSCAVIIGSVVGYAVLAYRIVREVPRKKRNEQPGNENPDED